MNIQTNLFDFAYMASWFDSLDDLSRMALPEQWCFSSPGKTGANTEFPILERYIKIIFHKQAIAYITAEDYVKADQAFHIRNEFACLHTGLFTKRYDGIYMCFERNKRKNSMLEWYFKGWADKSSPWLKYVEPLPKRPLFSSALPTCDYFPEWETRVNVDHILGDEENRKRLPESLRDAWNLPLLLETAVELGRRRALVTPSIVVPQVFQGCIQHLMPIYMTNPDHPDLAMALSTMDGYYYGHTCLTLQMAYLNARLLVRPTASWLRDLVEPERKQNDTSELGNIISALRIIDVLGQILRNYPGDISGENKLLAIEEVKELSMKIVGMMYDGISGVKDEILSELVNKMRKKNPDSPSSVLERKIKQVFNEFVFSISCSMLHKASLTLASPHLLAAINSKAIEDSDDIAMGIIARNTEMLSLSVPNYEGIIAYNRELRSKNLLYAQETLRMLVAHHLKRRHCGEAMRDKLCAEFNLQKAKVLPPIPLPQQ